MLGMITLDAAGREGRLASVGADTPRRHCRSLEAPAVTQVGGDSRLHWGSGDGGDELRFGMHLHDRTKRIC